MIPSESDFQDKELFHVNPSHRFGYRDGLHIIIIKDPLTWFKSICKASYLIFFGNMKWAKHKLCPQNISSLNGSIR